MEATKQYEGTAFLVDRGKLSRIVSILERYSTTVPLRIHYKIVHANGKELQLGALEELVSLDNPVKNTINSLNISAESISGSSISFTGSISYSQGSYNEVELVTSSNDAKLANEVYAELEEQVERTLLTSLIYRWFNPRGILLRPLLFLILTSVVAVVALSFVFSLNSQFYRRMHLDATGLAEQAKAAQSTGEKIDFIF